MKPDTNPPGRPVPVCAAAGLETSDATPTAKATRAMRVPRGSVGSMAVSDSRHWDPAALGMGTRSRRVRAHPGADRPWYRWSCRQSGAISRRCSCRKWASGRRSRYPASFDRPGSRARPRRTACKRQTRCSPTADRRQTASQCAIARCRFLWFSEQLLPHLPSSESETQVISEDPR